MGCIDRTNRKTELYKVDIDHTNRKIEKYKLYRIYKCMRYGDCNEWFSEKGKIEMIKNLATQPTYQLTSMIMKEEKDDSGINFGWTANESIENNKNKNIKLKWFW